MTYEFLDYRVRVGLSGRNAGAFRVGSRVAPDDPDLWAGYDRIGYAFTPSWTAADVLTDTTLGEEHNHLAECAITRGRSADMAMMEDTSIELTLVDVDGTFNPRNPASPYYQRIVPGIPVLLEASADGGDTWVPRGGGWVAEADADPGGYRTHIRAHGILEWLALQPHPVIAAQPATSVGEVLRLILAAKGWENPDTLELAEGEQIAAGWEADGTQDATALISALLGVFGGLLYQREDLTVVYEPEGSEYEKPLALDLGAKVQATAPGSSSRRIVNVQSVKRQDEQGEGGATYAAQVYRDEESIGRYGERPGTAIDSPWITGDVQARRLAKQRVNANRSPHATLWRTTVTAGDADTRAAVLLGLRERVRLQEDRFGTSGEFLIEQATERIENAGKLHTVSWALSEAPSGPVFRVGSLVAPDDPALWAGYDRIRF
jgi:hypothetical protein